MNSTIRLLQAAGHKPRFHGNGFTQLYLDPSHRLHVWHPDLPPLEGNNATIHDHIWDMRSRVLLGSLNHITYSADSDEIDGTHISYLIDQPAVRRGDTTDVFRRLAYATPIVTGGYLMAEGSSYSFPAFQLHESWAGDPDRLSATLMSKGPDANAHRWPRILAPVNEVPFQAFGQGTQPDEETLWGVIEEAVSMLDAPTIRQIESLT